MDIALNYSLVSIAITVAELLVMGRILLRPHRSPATRVTWLVVVGAVPLLGIIAYLLLGEVNVGRARLERMQAVLARLPKPQWTTEATVAERQLPLFRLGRAISGFPPVAGNSARLMADSNAAIDELVSDIDAAREHVHLLFYIWLPDNNGCKVIEALKRAAARGVICRAMVDDLGSRLLIRSEHWQAMRAAGIRAANDLPVGNPIVRAAKGRIDLRNHRKIVIIDNRITYCGSQNCADPEFLVKAKFAPWVDVVVRFEGPIARQNQTIFAGDWMARVDEDLSPLLNAPLPEASPDAMPAQAIATGPTLRNSAMPDMFAALFFAAKRDIVATTPYFVPNEALLNAICACAWRGVATTLILPKRNDSRIVAAASRSYYGDLLAAGVRLLEYEGGLLHAKTLTLDCEVTLIGSANMDRRSFDLNYENNILVSDAELTLAVRHRQEDYMARSYEVTKEMVAGWSLPQRLRNNAVATLGPLF